MNKLICMVGLPRSGKTTEAKKMGFPIVCPDAVRLAMHGEAFIPSAERMVWTMAEYMVKALFLAGHSTVILDATNTTIKRRNEWKSKEWNTEFVAINTSVEECLKRAKEVDFPEAVVLRMSNQFEPLTADEIGGE